MTDRKIPDEGVVYYRTRVCFEKEGRFRDLWQKVGANGQQVGYVDDQDQPVEIPELHTAIPEQHNGHGVPHFFPCIETDPDPQDTEARRAAARLEAANAAIAAAATANPPEPPQP